MLIWLLSGVKQTKEATEAARVSSGPIEVKIGTADALRPQSATLCQDPRLEPRRQDRRSTGRDSQGPPFAVGRNLD